jgi:hypothetical protein
MKNFEVGQTTTTKDLARALAGERGSYLVRNENKVYLCIAAEGHSIANLIPLSLPETGPGEWGIAKISDSTEVATDLSSTGTGRNSYQERQNR